MLKIVVRFGGFLCIYLEVYTLIFIQVKMTTAVLRHLHHTDFHCLKFLFSFNLLKLLVKKTFKKQTAMGIRVVEQLSLSLSVWNLLWPCITVKQHKNSSPPNVHSIQPPYSKCYPLTVYYIKLILCSASLQNRPPLVSIFKCSLKFR